MSIEDLLVSIRDSIDRQTHVLEQLVTAPGKSDGHLVSIKHAAEQLGLCHQTIRNRIASGEYQAYGSGTAIRVDVQEIRAIMARARAPHKSNGSHVLG